MVEARRPINLQGKNALGGCDAEPSVSTYLSSKAAAGGLQMLSEAEVQPVEACSCSATTSHVCFELDVDTFALVPVFLNHMCFFIFTGDVIACLRAVRSDRLK